MILAGARAMTAMAKPSARRVQKPGRFLQNRLCHEKKVQGTQIVSS